MKRLVAAGVTCAAVAFLAALLISEAAAGSPSKPRTVSHRTATVKKPAPDTALARQFSGSPGTLKASPRRHRHKPAASRPAPAPATTPSESSPKTSTQPSNPVTPSPAPLSLPPSGGGSSGGSGGSSGGGSGGGSGSGSGSSGQGSGTTTIG